MLTCENPLIQEIWDLRTITFDTGGGSSVPSQYLLKGYPIAYPGDPVKRGWDFLGWFTEDLDIDPAAEEWDFNIVPDGSMTLYAGWKNIIFAGDTYKITGDTASGFTATGGYLGAGFTNANIQTVINKICTDAEGYDCVIQFGSGGAGELDIESDYITFNNDNGTWGKITLEGSISSSRSTGSNGTITINGNITIESTANIKNTGSANAIYHGGTGTLTICGGTISAATGTAISNISTGNVIISETAGATSITSANENSNGAVIVNANMGSVTISAGTITNTTTLNIVGIKTVINNTAASGRITITGGTIKNTSGNYIRVINNSGILEISGGAISATGGCSNGIYNQGSGRVTISGSAEIISENNINGETYSGTIYIAASSSNNTPLTISGGTITNTENNTRTIFNNSTQSILITGGEIKATPSSYAVNSEKSGSGIILDGTPTITGNIRTAARVLSVQTGFAPGTNNYTLDFGTLSSANVGNVAVVNGATFLDKFSLNNPDYALDINGDNLVIANVVVTFTVNFESNGGAEVSPVTGISSGSKINMVTLAKKESDFFRGWYKESTLENKWDFITDTVTSNITLYAKWSPYTANYSVGNIGPGNGEVFYVSAEGFVMQDTGEVCHYLEAAPSNSGTNVQWGDYGTRIDDITTYNTADYSLFGNGRKDTKLIVMHMNGKNITGTAAQVCVAENFGNLNDWFLPSLGELYLYQNSEATSKPTTEYYWSSTQVSNNSAYSMGFNNGTGYGDYKSVDTNLVRAIRAF